jgi:hypothetical protein
LSNSTRAPRGRRGRACEEVSRPLQKIVYKHDVGAG